MKKPDACIGLFHGRSFIDCNRATLENQLEQGDDHNQADQKNDADGAAEELEHYVSPGFFRLKVGTAAGGARFLKFCRSANNAKE
jgi:hypothetical protein